MASGGNSSLRCVGFSCYEAWALGTRASVVVAQKLSSCDSRASLLCFMWDLLGPGIEPVSPALAGGFLTTAPPWKSYFKDLIRLENDYEWYEVSIRFFLIWLNNCVSTVYWTVYLFHADLKCHICQNQVSIYVQVFSKLYSVTLVYLSILVPIQCPNYYIFIKS